MDYVIIGTYQKINGVLIYLYRWLCWVKYPTTDKIKNNYKIFKISIDNGCRYDIMDAIKTSNAIK